MRWFRRAGVERGLAVVSPFAGGVAALRMQERGGRPRLEALAWAQAQQPDAETLSRLVREIKAGKMDLLALLDPADYQCVVIDAPPAPEDELMAAARWKVRELLDFHIDDAVLDYLPLPPGAGRAPMLFVVAAKAQAIRQLAQPYQEANLRLEVIDIAESAQHAFAARLAIPDYALALLHLAEGHALLTFSFGADLILARRIEGQGLTGPYLYERVALEVQRSVDYFERHYSQFPLARLYLAPAPDLEALQARLVDSLALGVERIDLQSLIDLQEAPQLHSLLRQNQFFHLLGAALRQSV